MTGGFRKFAADHPHLLSSQTSLCGNSAEDVLITMTTGVATTSSSMMGVESRPLCTSPGAGGAYGEGGSVDGDDQVVPSMSVAEEEQPVLCSNYPGMDQVCAAIINTLLSRNIQSWLELSTAVLYF